MSFQDYQVFSKGVCLEFFYFWKLLGNETSSSLVQPISMELTNLWLHIETKMSPLFGSGLSWSGYSYSTLNNEKADYELQETETNRASRRLFLCIR